MNKVANGEVRKDSNTGEERLAKNVTASFAGHFVFIVLGFVMPRMIDNSVGQAGLGIWDLAWTVVNYLSLSMMGIGSSVNRFVAKYRAAADNTALSRLVSTVMAIQLLIACIVLCATLVLSHFIPVLLSETLADMGGEAQYVVGFLGAALAVQMSFDAWRGVLSGCHRWDLYNAINAGGYALNAMTMIVVLVFGGGLQGIAITYFVMTVVTEGTRYFVARRVCPELRISRSEINLEDGRTAFRFGIKTMVLGIPGILVTQTVNIFVVSTIGPSALAILSRPLSLISHISTLMNKYTFVLTPVAGSIQSARSSEQVRSFAASHARTGWIFAIPPLAFVFAFGDSLLGLWMGERYIAWYVTATLAAGYLLPISQSPILRILIGMDEHGRIAQTSLGIALVVLPVGLLIGFTIGWSLELAALVIAISVCLSSGLNVFYHGFRVFEWSLVEYYSLVLRDPIRLALILAIVLYNVNSASAGLSHAGAIAAGFVATVIVFFVACNKDMKKIIGALFKKEPAEQ